MTRISLLEQAHQHIARYLTKGGVALDATLGNGYDTLYLAQCVGHNGQVFGFDIQPAALDATKLKLRQAGLLTNATLYQVSHALMDEYLPAHCQGRIQAMMFNLGYLPGSDKTVVTQAESTLIALTKACEWLAAPGIITVMVYPGHTGGDQEWEQLQYWLQQIDSTRLHHRLVDSDRGNPAAPKLLFIEKLANSN